MWRLASAALISILITATSHADFRSEFVEVFAQVGAKTVKVLIEKRAEMSGALVLNVIGSAIYDKGKELVGSSKFKQDTPIPARVVDQINVRNRMQADLKSLTTSLNDNPTTKIKGLLSKPQMSSVFKTWLDSQDGKSFMETSSKFGVTETGVRFTVPSQFYKHQGLDYGLPSTSNP